MLNKFTTLLLELFSRRRRDEKRGSGAEIPEIDFLWEYVFFFGGAALLGSN